ncbi:MAG TPA: 4Fe-4S binding protein [Candidatus Paceibacterota bacterium]|nr:4Fe-4S binding protein [Verrucomicrobiota bacterium]HSA12743.1 4Fe-4S binding protein [Candidatus Paceibacterota bacterium]
MSLSLRFANRHLSACSLALRKGSIVSRTWPAWLGILLLSVTWTFAEQRFPPPDFESGHQLPVTTTPPARALTLEYLDVAVLAGCLGLASWMVYRRRSRTGLVALSIFSLLYFGFWRKGCVCAIGSLQNVSLALCDRGYAVPLSVIAFFVLPLVLALFAGRTFCAGVCPHGALQDLVLLKPVKVPAWLEQALSVLPFIYLGAGVLFAATGSAFIICQYDPFVPIFRLSGRTLMVLSGAALLMLGMFVGRPYCRFLCPYGALLKLGAIVAKWRVRVTPDYCTQCRLCETSCPFGAMREPQASPAGAQALTRDRRRLALLLALAPVLLVGGAWLGSAFSAPASRLHPTVSLADQLASAQGTAPKFGALSPDDLALERARQTPREILTEAVAIQRKFATGGWIFGAWVGLVIGSKLISLSVRRQRTDYEPDRGGCFACARCFEFCPNELVRRGLMPAAVPIASSAASPQLPGRS